MQTKKLSLIATILLSFVLPVSADNSQYDALTPFGFATCVSRTDANPTTSNITGGGACTYAEAMALKEAGTKKVIVLTSTGADQSSAISSAIGSYDIIIFDGSKGDFLFKNNITINRTSKTLLGINNARLCSMWYATAEDIAALTKAGVQNMSTSSGTGGTLTNGKSVSEQAEYNTRQIMIDRYNDKSEWWCKSGIFYIKSSRNIIIRNLTFCGPGAMDLGGADLISIISSSNHIWVDHCDFMDGQDGNMDITEQSDYVTVSWCTFSYTERSFMHMNTNLCGGSDSSTGDDAKLNITWAYNNWGKGCQARMPMARFGRFHMLNNYFTCTGNGSPCINPRINSEFLIEGNYFDASIKKVYSASNATQVVWRSNNFVGYSGASKPAVDDNTETSALIPYTYTLIPVDQVPAEVGNNAGAKLDFTANSIAAISSDTDANAATYNLSGQHCSNRNGLMIHNGRVCFRK